MFLFLFSLLITLCLFYNFYWKRRTLPPGPTPWPIFGNAFEVLKKDVYQAHLDWAKKYGPIHTFWQGELPIVAVCDYETINETFIKDGDSYAGRYQAHEDSTQNLGGTFGVVNTEGDFWRDQRRFALHVFRDFGMGKNLMQERVLDEVSSLIEKVNKDVKNGVKEVNIASYIDVGVGSIINALLFNYRFDENHVQEFYKLQKLMSEWIRHVGHPLLQVCRERLWLLKYLPKMSHLYNEVIKSKKAIYDFFRHQVDEHQSRVDHDSEPTDYVEAFLREKARREEENGGKEDPYYTKLQLLNMCADLWMAGQETTSNTLGWGMIYMMMNQKVQEALQKELDSVIGSDRLITLEDKPKLHYTNAVVSEIQRIANLLPINVFHTTTKDVEIKGYMLKKGTIIIPHITVLLWDEKVFSDPEKFKPDRFLDLNGNWKRVDELVPFSVGKRQCLGEGLARMELFLFVANIFNQFKLQMSPYKPPSMKRTLGATIAPNAFVCEVEKRY